MKTKLIILLIIFGLFLAACNQNTDITFYTNQTWKYQISFSYDPTWLIMVGQYLPQIIEALGMDIDLPGGANHPDQTVMDELIERVANEYRSRGFRVSTRRRDLSSGEVEYQINISGSSFQSFEQITPENISLVQVAEDQYHLQMYMSGFNELGQVFEQTVTIHTGGIISSNASVVDGKTAIWYSPQNIDLVFTPLTPWGKYLPYIFAVIVGMVLLFIISRALGKKQCLSCGARVPRRAEFCNICGTPFQLATESTYQEYNMYSGDYADQESKPRRGFKAFITIIIILIIVVVSIILLNR